MKKKVILVLLCIFIINGIFGQTLTFDATNWLAAMDQLYANYDMIMNSITQIENQYKSIQQAIENAKGIDWENIQFDGDFDIRDDIKDANKRVNNLLSQANAIKNTLNTTIIQTDGTSYSLADLCGFGDEGKSFGSCVQDVHGYMKMNMLQAASYAVGNLTDEQKKAIWQKYGISPQNYYLAVQSSNLVKQKAQACIASVTEDAEKLKKEEKIAKTSAIFNAAIETKTADGTIPEGAFEEAKTRLITMIVDECISLADAIDKFAALSAQQIITEEQQKEIEASERLAAEKSNEINKGNLPANFAAGNYEVQ